MSGPLSLETCCFLKLIGHLETFPCDSLALLPLRLRYVLIQNLPAADVCRLEQSRFVEAMDMERVWATLVKENVLPKFLHSELNPKCTKDNYFSKFCSIILNQKSFIYTRQSDVLRFLFSVNECLGIEDWSTFAHPFCQQFVGCHQNLKIPPRYSRYFTSPQFSNIELVRLALDASRYYCPKLLSLDCRSFSENFFSQEWLFPDNLKMLTTYLHQIRHLSLKFYYSNPSGVSILTAVPPFIFSVLSNNGVLKLKDFSVCDFSGQFTENTVFAISPYVKESDGSRSCNTLETLSLLTTPGCHRGTVTRMRTRQLSELATLDLVDIIDNQIQLRKVELCGYRCNGLPSMLLCSALANLLQQPQFQEMHLGLSGVTAGSFQELLYSYLTAPCSKDVSLCLKIHTAEFEDLSTFSHNLICLNIPQENILHKTLELSSVKLPDVVFVWIHEHVCLRLKELKLVSPCLALMNLLLNHPRLEVEGFRLTVNARERGTLLHSPQCFDNILGSVHLRRFKIIGLGRFARRRTEYLSPLLVALVSGLHKQAQVGKLELFDISFNRWGALPEAELSLLFEAIFSLPQLEQFTLDISYSHFIEQHIKLLCKCWKEVAGGKQLKKVKIARPGMLTSFFEVDTASTEKIAKELVTKRQAVTR